MIEEVTLCITVKYDPDYTSPVELVDVFNTLITDSLVAPMPDALAEHGNPIISEVFQPSKEDEAVAFEALSLAMDVARRELGKLKETLESGSSGGKLEWVFNIRTKTGEDAEKIVRIGHDDLWPAWEVSTYANDRTRLTIGPREGQDPDEVDVLEGWLLELEIQAQTSVLLQPRSR